MIAPDYHGVKTMQVAEMKARVAEIQWFHRINLGNGVITPGVDDTAAKLEYIKMPADLKGMTVLDIGAWDGFFSFEAERRGASRVLATDWFCWGGPGWGTQAGFRLAREALNSKVEDLEIDAMDIAPEKVGSFDMVLFLGVLYHLRHPFLAIEKVASVTNKLLILETWVDLLNVPVPAMAFYPTDELNGDGSNWWGPNQKAVEGMLKDVGFKHVEVVSTALMNQAKTGGRMVFHAWR
jgi:tRNA (mo5U34)-methyltransferase